MWREDKPAIYKWQNIKLKPPVAPNVPSMPSSTTSKPRRLMKPYFILGGKLSTQHDESRWVKELCVRILQLIQDLWKQNHGWDDQIERQCLWDQWLTWEQELPNLLHLHFLWSFTTACTNTPSPSRKLHVFCVSVERAYRTVAYLLAIDDHGLRSGAIYLCASQVESSSQKTAENTLLGADCSPHWNTDMVSWTHVEPGSSRWPEQRSETSWDNRPSHWWNSGPEFLLQMPDQWPVTAGKTVNSRGPLSLSNTRSWTSRH